MMRPPVYDRWGVQVHGGDCLDVLREFPDEHFAAVVTDPPYSYRFMGKSWDAHESPLAFQRWCEGWARECLRVLKPGGMMLAFGGTRTFHRLTCGIEDAGFEIRDSIDWLYAGGMPKGINISKAIDRRPGVTQHAEFGAILKAARLAKGYTNSFDVSELVVGRRTGAVANWEKYQFPEAKWWPALRDLLGMDPKWDVVIAEAEREVVGQRTTGIGTGRGSVAYIGDSDNRDVTAPATDAARQWEGWNTQLRPAHESITVARKPFRGTVASNVLAHGTGGINVDACRVGTDIITQHGRSAGQSDSLSGPNIAEAPGRSWTGRWPPNVILSHVPSVDPATGEVVGDACAQGCVDGCPVRELDQQSGITTSSDHLRNGTATGHDRTASIGAFTVDWTTRGHADAGGAARFFPCFRFERQCVLWCMLPVCEGHVSVVPSPSPKTGTTRDSVASPASPATQPSSGGTEEWSREPANSVEQPSKRTPAPTASSAPRAAMTKADGRNGQRVKSAVNLCDSCATAIAQSAVATQHGHDPARILGLPSIAASAYSTLTRSLAYVADALAKCDTTPTTTDLTTSCGYVVHVIKESIIKERSSQRNESALPQFIWASKAPTAERPRVAGESHSTVKPLSLIRFLVRLCTPPGGIVLDCFAGTGTTGQAARAEGFPAVLIDNDPAAIPWIVARLDAHPREDKPTPARPAAGSAQPDLFTG